MNETGSKEVIGDFVIATISCVTIWWMLDMTTTLLFDMAVRIFAK